MIFGKTIFLLRCPYYNCKKILGEVDSEGRIKTKSKRAGIDIISLFAILICRNHGTEIHWKSREVLQLIKG